MAPELYPTIATGSASSMANNLVFFQLATVLGSFLTSSLFSQVVVTIATSSLVTLLLTHYFESMNEKRKLFAEAYKAALAWQEMLYRVRRRATGIEAEQKLVERFHELQEAIDYYQGLISTESEALGSSYERLVNLVKEENNGLIQEAWKSPVRRPKAGIQKADKHPKTLGAGKLFLKDTRDWFSIWQLPKLFVIWRNWRHK